MAPKSDDAHTIYTDKQALPHTIADRRATLRPDQDTGQLIFLETYTRGSQLIDRLTVAMAHFEKAEQDQHATDPANFPLVRTETDWWNEFRAWMAHDYATTEMGMVDSRES